MSNIFKRFYEVVRGEKKKTVRSVKASSSIRDSLLNRTYYNDNSDLYTALGYPLTISYYDYKSRYLRQDIAHRIVKSPVEQTWKDKPNVYESTETDTSFEIAYDALVKELDVYYWLYKLDLEANIGKYAILYLGLDGDEDVALPPTSSKNLVYLSVFPEPRADILQWDTDPTSPRFGMPVIYQLQTDIDGTSNITRQVHWSRIIHVAENTLESEIYGIPVLEPIYNRLIGLEKLAGGSPEMYWNGARPGYTATISDNGMVTDDQLDEIKSQLSDFSKNLKRWLFIEGADITALAPQVVSPKDHFDIQMKLISAATRIPLRMLTGSERGELASVQDEISWMSYIEERRISLAEPKILRPFIDRMIELGILPPPKDEYYVEWDPLVVTSEKDKAEIGRIKAESLSKYVSAPGADIILPPEMFMAKILDMTEGEIELALDIEKQEIREEDSLREQEDEDQ